MKNIRIFLIAPLLLSFLLSCSKDHNENGNSLPVVVLLFESTSVMENSATLGFRIPFDKPAQQYGYIIIEVHSTNDDAFHTNPPVVDGEIFIPVAKGQNFANLEFSPLDNDLLEENTVVTLHLAESSKDITFGSIRSTTVEITDDEAPAFASFNSSHFVL